MAAAEARQAQLELEGNIVRAYVQLSLQYAEMDIAKAMLQQQRDILALAQRACAAASARISRSARRKCRCPRPSAASR